jgi:hypothetical protein
MGAWHLGTVPLVLVSRNHLCSVGVMCAELTAGRPHACETTLSAEGQIRSAVLAPDLYLCPPPPPRCTT